MLADGQHGYPPPLGRADRTAVGHEHRAVGPLPATRRQAVPYRLAGHVPQGLRHRDDAVLEIEEGIHAGSMPTGAGPRSSLWTGLWTTRRRGPGPGSRWRRPGPGPAG